MQIDWRGFLSFLFAQEEAEEKEERDTVRPRSSSCPRDHDQESNHMRTDDIRAWPGGSGGGHWESARFNRRGSTPKEWRRVRALPNRHREHGGLKENRFSGGLFEGGNTDVTIWGTADDRGAEDIRASTAPHLGRKRRMSNNRSRVSNELRVNTSAKNMLTKWKDAGPGVGDIPDKAAALRVLDELLDDQQELEAFLNEEFARRGLVGRQGVNRTTGVV